MEYGEFVADPDRPDEGTTRWVDRPLDIPLQAPAQAAVHYPVPLYHGSLMPSDSPTSIDLQYDPQPTSLVPFRFNQQLPDSIENVYAHEAHLTEDVQRQLAEVRWQHEVARYQILEKAQAIPAMSHIQEATTSYPYAAMSEPAAGYAGVHDTSNVPARLPQIPNQGFTSSESSSTYGFDVHSWPGQQFTPAAIHPNTVQDHAQSFGQQGYIFTNAQVPEYNAFGHSAHGQQPPIDLTPFDRGSYPFTLMAPTQSPPTQFVLPIHDCRSVSASERPMYTANDWIYDTTAPLAGPSWNRDLHPSGDRFQTPSMPELLPSSGLGDSVRANVHITRTTGPQNPVTTSTGLVKRGRREEDISKSASARRAEPIYNLDSIHFHTNPDADRQRRSVEPRRRHVTEKASSSCFGCRYSKSKCTISTGYVCLECEKVLATYSNRTALPKFTCNVRMKFSEMLVFTNEPLAVLSNMKSLPRIPFDASIPGATQQHDHFPHPTTTNFTDSPLEASLAVVQDLLRRVRILLDLIEPLHLRRFSPLESDTLDFWSNAFVMLWSYSFSMVRWKSAICFFWPDLKDALDLHESVHRGIHQVFLRRIDYYLSSGHSSAAAMSLTVWYEGVATIEPTPSVNIPIKEFFLSSATHHLLHLYRRMAPASPGRKGSRKQAGSDDSMKAYNLFPKTSKLVPAAFWLHRERPSALWLLQYHRTRSFSRRTSKGTITSATDPGSSPDSSKRPEHLSSRKAYFPTQIPAIFDLDTKMLNLFEEMAHEDILYSSRSFRKTRLEFSPWAISIALKVLLNEIEIESCTQSQKPAMLLFLAKVSLRVWDFCGMFYAQSGETARIEIVDGCIVRDQDEVETSLIESLASDEVTEYWIRIVKLKRRLKKAGS